MAEGSLGIHYPEIPDTDHAYTTAVREIQRTFLTCPVQRIAMETILADILKCDFSWTSTVRQTTYSKKISMDAYEHAMWTDFVRQIVQQILLYGFVVYRLRTIKASPKTDLEEKHIPHHRNPKRQKSDSPRGRKPAYRCPEVADGLLIVLRWGEKEHRWIPHSPDGKPFTRAEGWRMLQPMPPDRVGLAKIPVIRSCAASALDLSKLRKQVYANIGRRDDRNTNVELYAQTVKSMNRSGVGVDTQEWFQSQTHGTMGLNAAPGDVFQPTATMIAGRLDTAVGLQRMSEVIRKMDNPAAAKRMGSRVQPPGPEEAKDHKEHFVTDGREAREVSYRRGPEEIMRILDELFVMILFTYSVMPHIIGKNINSERMAGSNRMAEVSIERYIEFIKQLRRFVQMAITEVSSEAVDDANTRVRMDPCITSHTLSMVESILTTEAAIELNACVYDIPVEAFDKERMKLKQLAMLVKPGAEQSDGETKKPNDARAITKDRAPLTQDQKDSNMKAKTAK